jgi:hypothetical protein
VCARVRACVRACVAFGQVQDNNKNFLGYYTEYKECCFHFTHLQSTKFAFLMEEIKIIQSANTMNKQLQTANKGGPLA